MSLLPPALQYLSTSVTLTSCVLDMQAHAKVVEERGVTQRHYDMIASLLVSSLRTCGADVSI